MKTILPILALALALVLLFANPAFAQNSKKQKPQKSTIGECQLICENGGVVKFYKDRVQVAEDSKKYTLKENLDSDFRISKNCINHNSQIRESVQNFREQCRSFYGRKRLE